MTAPIRVGIADDDEIIRFSLTKSLSLSPFLHVVAAVEDGLAAVCLAESGHIDVLVLDMEMPKMSGPEALGHILALAPHVRVIIHSSLPASKIAAEMLRGGAVAYLEKPCDVEQMVSTIRDAAGIQRRGRSSAR